MLQVLLNSIKLVREREKMKKKNIYSLWDQSIKWMTHQLFMGYGIVARVQLRAWACFIVKAIFFFVRVASRDEVYDITVGYRVGS